MSTILFYTLSYFLMAGCIMYPPSEFMSAGLTINDIFETWLGSETEDFVHYQIRRTIATVFVHSLVPFGYILGLIVFGQIDFFKTIIGHENLIWLFILVGSIVIHTIGMFKISEWVKNDHPLALTLALYCNNNTKWYNVAEDLNAEYRRIDKLQINTSSVTRIVATDNWIIKISPYKVQVAHQSDTSLIVNRSDTHSMSPNTRGEVQFLNIQVRPARPGVEPFDIRLNAVDFKNLQDKVVRPITVLQNIIFHKSLLERFVDTFREEVSENPIYDTTQEMDQCIGCMQVPANIKLTKLCTTNAIRNANACTACYCRPMWCIECMAKWFASKQDENAPETWLSSKCTCPVCRATFCILDVCLVRSRALNV